MDTSEQDFRRTVAFALKHRTRLLPRSKIAGAQDSVIDTAAGQIVDHILSCGWTIAKKPPAPLHSADCGKR